MHISKNVSIKSCHIFKKNKNGHFIFGFFWIRSVQNGSNLQIRWTDILISSKLYSPFILVQNSSRSRSNQVYLVYSRTSLWSWFCYPVYWNSICWLLSYWLPHSFRIFWRKKGGHHVLLEPVHTVTFDWFLSGFEWIINSKLEN